MKTKPFYFPTLEQVKKAADNLKNIASVTPLIQNANYSTTLNANIL